MAKAAVKKTGTALVKWDEELAKYAKQTTKGVTVSTGSFVSLKGGKLSIGGANVPNNELMAVIVGAVRENQYYDEDYDPNVPQTPACYAFGLDEDDMTPHDKAPRPQCEGGCAACPLNEYGSADKGKGKACKNVLRLAMIAGDDLENIAKAEVVYLKVPVMSVKNWAAYAGEGGKLDKVLKRPYWAVVTKVFVEPDDKSQFKVNFEVEEKIESGELFGPLKELWEKTMEGIGFPYQVQEAPKKETKSAKKSKFAARR